jgi:hypothetical protein
MSELVFNRIILQRTIQILTQIAIGLLILNIVQAMVLVKFSRKPVLVVQEDQDGKVEMLDFENFEITEKVLKHFVQWIAKEYLSFSPTSLPSQIEGIEPYLATGPKESILNSYKKNKSVIESGVFFQFNISELELSKRSNPYVVDVRGELSVIDKNGHYKRQEKTYIFEVLKVIPTDDNPYGLKVMNIVQKKDKEGEGK